MNRRRWLTSFAWFTAGSAVAANPIARAANAAGETKKPIVLYCDLSIDPLEAKIKDLSLPNGLAFSPDGKTLYVANFGPERFVSAYDVGTDGRIGNARVLIKYGPDERRPGGPDGLKVDSVGNIWTTGPGGIRIVTSKGKVLGQLVLPEVAANLAFAEQGKVLYITATSSIYKLALRTPGTMPLYQR